MPLTQAVIDNVANAALDYHMDRGQVHNQHIQDKPLLNGLRARQRSFPGGKENVSLRPVFETQSGIEGFNSDDTLTFVNPTPIKNALYPWKMIHTGIQMTTDELLRDGISVTDTDGRQTTEHTEREVTALANILQVKLEDMSEGFSSGMNEMLWRDGTQDAKEVAGIRYLLADDPSIGVIGGIDRATQPKWRNVTLAGTNAMAADTVVRTLQKQVRQLRRYGNPRHLILCGSDFIDAVEKEVYEKGYFTQTGFSGERDIGIGKLRLNGLGTFEYDPTLDDLGLAKYAYFIDTNSIRLMPIEGEDMKKHRPARPHDKMVIYRSVTWAGALAAKQLNTSMVAAIA